MLTETNLPPDLQDRIYPDSVDANGVTELRMHIYRYNWALRHTLVGGKTLDAGCGAGYGSRMLSFISSKVLAIDTAESAITYAKKKFPSDSIDYQIGDVFALQEKDFDTVVAFEMLEHNQNTRQLLIHLISRLKTGRKGLFSLPINSTAPGHKQVFNLQQAKDLFAPYIGRLFYQNLGDITEKPRDDALIILALVIKG